MGLSFAKVRCETEALKMGLTSGVSILGATAITVVPKVPPYIEGAEAYLLVAGDVGDHGVALEAGMRWLRAPDLDVCGSGGSYDLSRVAAFRLAHRALEPIELVYSIRKGN